MSASRTILISGAGGNLGRKLTDHLLGQHWCAGVIALDVVPVEPRPGIRPVRADAADAADTAWREALRGVDAVVHLAAANPAPDSSWAEASRSLAMTLNLAFAGAAAGVRRFVFASSNHAMGQYKDPPLAVGPGELTPERDPAPGTRWFDGEKMIFGVAYGSSKLLGERVATQAAALSRGSMTSVSVRIGWCQPGANEPATMNPSGHTAAEPLDYPDAARDLTWFRSMWLSNRDYCQVMERAILAEADGWPAPGIVVNGMSANAGMPWDLQAGRRLIGFAPQDNVWDHLPRG